MIKKLYIPTSTLNFNNILSSESVSPKAFYKERNFGYTRWFCVDENALENAIILYPSFFAFSRPQSDLEDHPMIIEILINVNELKCIDNDLYLCDHTIYLNPWETKFIFQSEHDKIVSLSLSNSSIETKMLRLYKNRLVVQVPNNFAHQTFKIDDVNLNSDAIEFDKLVNKYKGLLYGYYIGAYLSTNKYDANRTNYLIEIREIIAAILSSSNKKQTPYQANRLEELINLYNQNNYIISDISKIINDNTKFNLVLRKLQSSGIIIPGTISIDYMYDLIKKGSIEGDTHPSINWINKLISDQEHTNITHRQLLATDQAEIVCIDGKLNSITTLYNDNKPLLYSWINEILVNNKYSKNIISYRKELTDALTYKAKDIMTEKWQNCEEREILNKLRRHLNGEKFDICWKNNLLCSISSVIIAGDDWNKLFQFMRSKGMTDYRIAFAIYGIIVGFANMVRDFTDLLLNQDSNYLVDVYKEFYNQLFKKEINTQEQISYQFNDVVESTKNTISTTQLNDNSFEKKVLKAIQEVKRVNKEAKESLTRALDENASDKDCLKFMDILKKLPGWKTQKGPAKIWNDLYYKLVGNDYKSGINIKNKEEEPSLFYNSSIINTPIKKVENVKTPSRSILINTEWIGICANFIHQPKAKKLFIDDMEWFIDNHKETYFDKKHNTITNGRYYGHVTANSSIIERLKYFMENSLKSTKENMSWKTDKYKNIPIEKIISYLIDQYDY